MLIGIDVGATKIDGLLLDNKNKIVEQIKEPTQKTKKGMTKQLILMIKKLSEGRKIHGIGMGFPGCVDRKKGIVLDMPNMHIKNFNIGKRIWKEFRVPIKMENDGNCMAVAEYLFGYGKGKKNIVTLTVGTGVGGGMIADGKLYIGRGCAAEIGHLSVVPYGRKCNCGNTGCLEEYCAGRGIMRFAKEEKLKADSPFEIEQLARKGNIKARGIYEKVGVYLGIGISDIIKMADPEIVTILGSISHASDLFLDKTKEEVKKRVYFKPCEIKISKVRHAPALGAASLFLL
ncbi:MAG: ROK family protein [Candidatus Pacearchaeota archaeon]